MEIDRKIFHERSNHCLSPNLSSNDEHQKADSL